MKTGRLTAVVFAVLAVAACGGNPLESGDSDGAIVVGSQDYYSNEIIAEIYSQALEKEGIRVERQFRIGQREVYLPEIERGDIDLFPEYSGPLLQYWRSETKSRLADDVYAELREATPAGLRVLAQSPATDQDSYTVTKEFAAKWGIESIEDLAKVPTALTLGANSEAEQRPNGPKGLREVYGVEVAFSPIEDGGGPLTVKALKDDAIQLAIIYTADPSLAANNLVSIKDTKGLFLASHLVPIASDDVDANAARIVDEVSLLLTPEDLVQLNARSVNEHLPAGRVAADWLAEKRPG
ncbi:ABC transporter substrate-binding protein [Tessaracoccus sp. OH4464_COT-324]|uniref:ABC transporter substrate-binding protein n=1 Tax=Tessaracoccus sp. OH4464_COT-324 TaxID=2491059 RepID=UPI000F64383D|nr:ABC transporter substrate-binding protein [Tessaracoccus sp. OH4464_COT-324]RRD47992.1 ABC transporter substrate-binding protein [Tessaracoccus sp. OH4464_COT-324]